MEEKVGTILDVILCVIILCFVISGFRVGLVRSLVELVGYLFAVIASVVLANRLTGVVCTYFFQAKPVNMLDYAIARVITTAVIFVLLQLLVRLVSNALNTVCSLPILHQVNSLLGGVFGLLKGVLVVFLLCAVLQLMMPLITAKYPNITQKEIGKSCIYRYSYANNPIYKLYQDQAEI